MIHALLLAATVLFRVQGVDAKNGDAILDPVIAASIRVEQISGPTAAKGEALKCELINHAESQGPAEEGKVSRTLPAWSELKCKNGARYRIGPVRFTGDR